MTYRCLAAGALTLLLSASAGGAPTTTTRAVGSRPSRPTVRLIAFYGRDCPGCDLVLDPALNALARKTGARIEALRYDLGDPGAFETYIAYGNYLGRRPRNQPVVIIGTTVLDGSKEIKAHLETHVRQAVRQGGIGWTTLPAAFCPKGPFRRIPRRPERTVFLTYFYQTGCRECRRLTHVLRHLHLKHASVVLKEIDLSEAKNKRLLEAMSRRAGLPEHRRLAAATVFVDERAFVGEEATLEALEAAILAPVGKEIQPPWQIKDDELDAASTGILARFRKMGVWAVAGAGLIDGVNPCAFATIVFLVAYLGATGRRRRDALMCGAAFTLGVFVTYLGMGFGLKVLLDTMAGLQGVHVWLYRGAAGLCFVLGVVSLVDYVRARRKGLKAMRLVLPGKWRVYTRSLIARRLGTNYLILASVLLGGTISLVELACTGQVYLPTIAYVIASSPTVPGRAYAMLVLYNVMFVLPLVVVFGLVALGLSSRRLAAFSQRHLGKTKLALAGVFLLLAVGLLALSVG